MQHRWRSSPLGSTAGAVTQPYTGRLPEMFSRLSKPRSSHTGRRGLIIQGLTGRLSLGAVCYAYSTPLSQVSRRDMQMFRLHRKESLQNLKLNRVETNCQRMNLSGYPQKWKRRPPLTVLEQANARPSLQIILRLPR